MGYCKYCNSEIRSKSKLNQHELTCEWKEKIENWGKRVSDNKYKTFWYVDTDKYVLKNCVLSTYYEMIKFIQDDGNLSSYSQKFREEYLYEYKYNAQERLDSLKELYFETFTYKPYLTEDKIIKNLSELLYIESAIAELLKDYPDFKGIDYCDVGAHGIQIRGHHLQIKGYTYGQQITIKYDFSNYKECINEFVDMWKSHDIASKIHSEKQFIADGEKYGWD